MERKNPPPPPQFVTDQCSQAALTINTEEFPGTVTVILKAVLEQKLRNHFTKSK
jgi:hypothetical protein